MPFETRAELIILHALRLHAAPCRERRFFVRRVPALCPSRHALLPYASKARVLTTIRHTPLRSRCLVAFPAARTRPSAAGLRVRLSRSASIHSVRTYLLITYFLFIYSGIDQASR
jgi:hypothetical protein